MRLRTLLSLALLLLLAAPLSRCQEETSDRRLRRMQEEKMRIMKARREILIQGKGTPRDFVKIAFANIAKGNEKQYSANVRLANQCKEYEEVATKNRMEQRAKLYGKLARIYDLYAKQNAKIVKAYRAVNSAEMKEALAEIAKIEQDIVDLGLKPPKRDWFTMAEIEKVALPGQVAPQPRDAAVSN